MTSEGVGISDDPNFSLVSSSSVAFKALSLSADDLANMLSSHSANSRSFSRDSSDVKVHGDEPINERNLKCDDQ